MSARDERITTADIAGGAGRAVQPPQAKHEAGGQPERPAMLFSEQEAQDLRHNWDRIQTGFVDEPRRAVEEADQLVAVTIKRLAESFSKERANLEKQWDSDTKANTESLRIALQRYRSFFQRLLAF